MVRAANVLELRAYVNQDLADAGLGQQIWVDNVGPGVPVRAQHIVELRGALQRLWDFKGRGLLPPWSGVPPTAGGPIRASHITDLRYWLNSYETNHAQGQGISSHSYAAEAGVGIDGAWADEIRDLYFNPSAFGSAQRLVVRCEMVFPWNVTPSQVAAILPSYKAAFDLYTSRGCDVIALFSPRFYRQTGLVPNAELAPDLISGRRLSNAYLNEFGNRARQVSDYLSANTAVFEYMIWNEPNGNPLDTTSYLDELHFAALMDNCYSVDMPNAFRIYCGGILVPPSGVPGFAPYVSAVYANVVNAGLAQGTTGRPWPWDGINLHIHHNRSDIAAIGSTIRQIKNDENFDPALLIVGEWGVTLSAGPTALSGAYVGIRDEVRPDLMMYFSHPYTNEGAQGEWGLRCYNESGAGLRLCFADPPGPCTWCTGNPAYRAAQGRTNLYGAFDSIVGT
jgi:hypothetical protein